MSRWTHRTAAPLLCALLLLTGCQPREVREPLLYVNGEAVSQAELSLLDNDVERAVRMKALQQWATELGLTHPFSYEKLMEEMEEENRRRVAVKESGGVIYGVVEYTPLQYYNITMGEYERLLREELLSQAGEEDLRTYYREMGELTATVTVRWEGQVVSEQEILLAPDTYRSLSEGNELLVMHLENLWAGQEASWTDEYGMEWTALCVSRTEDVYQPFEDIQGAVGQQYAAHQLTQELDRRAGESRVEDLRTDSEHQS